MPEEKNKSYTAVGVMSGTSGDGLDLALCRFERDGNGDAQWKFEILKTKTLSYHSTSWPERFTGAETSDGFELMVTHRDFGRFTGEAINDFLNDSGSFIKPDMIASHGHTIFHRPGSGITLQIGDGAEIAAITGITTISDFRRLDVALGGNGAPLVPIGDELLFHNYTWCLNLGGFANISFSENGIRKAFDICPANIVLNHLAKKLGYDYDKDGDIAFTGVVVPELLNSLENLEYYKLVGPRSLGREWVEETFLPVLEGSDHSVNDKIRTVCEHIAMLISSVMQKAHSDPGVGGQHKPQTLFITGGGAKNKFLIGLISEKAAPALTVIPDENIVDFKEAIVFAFLGVLRSRNEINCLSSVTGARKDNSGGIIHYV